METVFIVLFGFIISRQFDNIWCAGNLSEPTSSCYMYSDLELLRTFMQEKFALTEEIKRLNDTVNNLQIRLGLLETELEEQPRYIPGPRVDIRKDYKIVTQSSEYTASPRPAELAVDGNLNTYSHTNFETNSWWAMEFCNDVMVAKVRLRNRPDCCDSQMANFVVTVDGVICGSVDNPIGVGRTIDVTCTKPLAGKRLMIQRTDSFLLSIAEVQVFSSVETC